MHRKKFLQLSSFGLGSFALPSWKSPPSRPIVVSTWDSGMPVNAAAWALLGSNGNALDAVEKGAMHIENEINCCVGLGGYPDRDGIVTLDACIMDGAGNCGAVAALERIQHPVSVARKVMEKTPHVLLAGAGAQQFAVENGFVLQGTALSESGEKAWRKWLEKSEYQPEINIEKKQLKEPVLHQGPFAPAYFDDGTPNHDTMGLLALDSQGQMAGAVTTSGMAFKMHGRVGDSPIIGAGLFVDNEAGAATSSGVGEEVIRICGTHLVVEFMRQGYSPGNACKKAVERIVHRDKEKSKKLQVGFVALSNTGEYGAYAIQKGFVISVRSHQQNEIVKAQAYFD